MCVCVCSRGGKLKLPKNKTTKKQWWKDSIRSWKINKLKRKNSNSNRKIEGKLFLEGKTCYAFAKVCMCVGAKYVQNLRRKSKWQHEKKVNAWNKSSVAEVATTLGCVYRSLAECFYWSWVMLWRALCSGCVCVICSVLEKSALVRSKPIYEKVIK